MREQIDLLLKSLIRLGGKRIAGVGAALAFLMASLAVAAIYLNRPAYETLYVGLERDDINRIGLALSEAGIDFDIDSNGSTVMVKAGLASQSRMVLAEKGLPASAGAGYELFDKLGSLGLTSFMQEVTRVRALEGEIARSIQAVNGVKAARVHIVIPDKSSFRDRDRKATASILVRADSNQIADKASAIRHLVAAAVPGLSTDDVTVMDSAGNLLASGQDQFANALTGALDVQRTVERDIEQKISLALGAQLGALNYRVSVQARINTDQSTTQETIFDPASRVERSVQVARAEDSSTQKAESQNTSVEQNLPNAKTETTSGPQSTEKRQKREETTNYEINSKQTESKRNGYRVERISISIVLNKKTLIGLLGKNPPKNAVETRLAEIQKMASAAAGLEKERGDLISLSAADFVDDAILPAIEVGIWDQMTAHAGTVINALAFILVAIIVLIFGFRPLLKTVLPPLEASDARIDRNISSGEPMPLEAQSRTEHTSAESESFRTELDSIKPRLITKTKVSPAERLKAMTELDTERTAKVLRKWLLEAAA